MKPITPFLGFACILAGLAIGHWVKPYLARVLASKHATGPEATLHKAAA